MYLQRNDLPLIVLLLLLLTNSVHNSFINNETDEAPYSGADVVVEDALRIPGVAKTATIDREQHLYNDRYNIMWKQRNEKEYTLSEHRNLPRLDSIVRTIIHFENRLKVYNGTHTMSKDLYDASKFHYPINSNNTKEEQKQQYRHRRRSRKLNNVNEYKPLRIHFDTSQLDEVTDDNTADSIKNLKDIVLPNLAKIWEHTLRVIPEEQPLRFLTDVCGPGVTIPQDYQTKGMTNTDLVIFIRADDCKNSQRLASAAPCLLHPVTDRPVVGTMIYCLGSQILQPASSGGKLTTQQINRATEVSSHEVTHILGLISSLYPFYRDRTTPDLQPRTPERPPPLGSVQCTDGRVIQDQFIPNENTIKLVEDENDPNVIHYEIVTPTVAQVTRNQFNCQRLKGAKLENQPTSNFDCYGSHWEERDFYTEFMGAIFNDEVNTMSPLTLALLEDSGWYSSNYNLASVSIFGLGAGCSFVENDCIINGLVPSYSKGFFCNDPLTLYENTLVGNTICDATSLFISQCDLVEQAILPNAVEIPKQFHYFPSESTNNLDAVNIGDASNSDRLGEDGSGGSVGPKYAPYRLYQADFCPTPSLRSIDCRNSNIPGSVPYETFGPNSRCYNTKLEALLKRDDPYAVCLESFCNPEKIALEVYFKSNDDEEPTVITCEYDGQAHHYPGLPKDESNVFECPRLAVACPHLICPQNCAGRGICNWKHRRPRCDCFDPTDESVNCINTPYGASIGYQVNSNENDEATDGAGYQVVNIGTPERPVEGVIIKQQPTDNDNSPNNNNNQKNKGSAAIRMFSGFSLLRMNFLFFVGCFI